MIPLSRINVQLNSWQQQFAKAVTDYQELFEILQLPEDGAIASTAINSGFPLKVTRDYLDCIEKGNLNDPLLKQILPVPAENESVEGFYSDPVGDLGATKIPGLIHKYHGRVLLIATPACAIHCRYCFRRHFPYTESSANGSNLEPALDYIQNNKQISEVILSGGDPLSLSDAQLEKLISSIQTIEHVKTIRLHSRLPVVLPDRITNELIKLLSQSKFQAVLVIHSNHPNELSNKVLQGLARFQSSGITLLNQSVILNSVNDHEDTLIRLSRKLFSAGVLPYYIHMLDRVSGAAHFAVSTNKAIKIHKKMQESLPGYLVPKLVREVTDFPHKMLINPLS